MPSPIDCEAFCCGFTHFPSRNVCRAILIRKELCERPAEHLRFRPAKRFLRPPKPAGNAVLVIHCQNCVVFRPLDDEPQFCLALLKCLQRPHSVRHLDKNDDKLIITGGLYVAIEPAAKRANFPGKPFILAGFDHVCDVGNPLLFKTRENLTHCTA